MIKSIVLITTGQPSVNPRIVKEADSLQNQGFDVTVLFCFFINWAREKDLILLKNVKWKYEIVGGTPTENKYIFLFTRIRYKLFRFLNMWLGNNFLIAERSQARAYDELLKAAKKIKADWYIGHNLGALPIAVKAALFNNAKSGFDFEDYHRGESFPIIKMDFKRICFLENKYVSYLTYYSTSSDLITDLTKKNHIQFKGQVITLLNCFPLVQQPKYISKKEYDRTLQLFWFSQTIGIGRGLEVLIKAINYLNDTTIHLTLAGRCNNDILKYINENAGVMVTNVHFAGIIQPENLPDFASKFDVGLAIETGFSENNHIALSNKLFTYLLAGNALVLSKTSMQYIFNKNYQVGENIDINNLEQLANKILYYKNTSNLNKQKLYNYQLANSSLNWENESQKLLAIIK